LLNNWRTVARSVPKPTFFDETDTKNDEKLTKPPAYCTRSSQSSVEDAEKLEKPPLTLSSDMYISAPASSASASAVPVRAIPDMYAPQIFDGVYPDPETWLAHFKRYVKCRQLTGGPAGVLSALSERGGY